MCNVAHLMWSGRVGGVALHDGEAVDSALKRAIKTAVQCMQPALQVSPFTLFLEIHFTHSILQVQLFTDVLDHYIYFAEEGCTQASDPHRA